MVSLMLTSRIIPTTLDRVKNFRDQLRLVL